MRALVRTAIFVVGLVAVVGGFVFRDRIATAVVARALPGLNAMAAAHGFACRDLRYEHVSVEDFAGTLVFHRPACRLHVAPRIILGLGLGRRPDGENHSHRELALSAASASVSLAPLPRCRLRPTVSGCLVERVDIASDAPTVKRVSAIDGELTLPPPGWRPRLVVELLRREAERILAEGRTDLDLSLGAVGKVPVPGTTHDLRLRSEPDVFGSRPSIAPDDACRHVYWSWLLTREYAAAVVPAAELAERVRTDPRVIRVAHSPR